MRQFDLAPLYRSTVGFDRLFSALDQFVASDAVPTYPPYNIERTAENAYRVTVAGQFRSVVRLRQGKAIFTGQIASSLLV